MFPPNAGFNGTGAPPQIPGLQHQYTVPSVDDFVDLDNFLDSYLVQLQSDNQMQGGNAARSAGLAPGLLPLGAVGATSAPLAPAGLGMLQLQQQQGMQGLLAFPGALGLDAVGANGASGIGASAAQNQLNMHLNAGLLNGTAPGMLSGPTMAGMGRGAPAGKTTRKGKSTGGRQTRKSEAEGSSSDLESSDSATSDVDHKSKRKQVTTDEAERRHQALQEKNRRAQRRFRERQKTKLADLHKQIEELTTKVSSLQSENAALHSRTSILEKVLDMRNEQIQVMQETKESTGFAGGEDDVSSLHGVGGQLVQLSPEMIKELSSDQIYKIYQTYVKELSVRLVDMSRSNGGAEGEPVGPNTELAADQYALLDSLVKDLCMMIMRLGVIKPLEIRKFIVVSRQYLGSSESEVVELWRNVMKSIDLNVQQKREVVELKRMFLQKIEPIMEERRHLNTQIQSNLPNDTFHTKNALTYIKAHEAVIKLRDNLRAEQHVVLEFTIAVFRGVFRPQQMATLLVKCYPAMPDALGIASALAWELGEPDSPQAQALAMQIGGYLDAAGGNVIGTNYLTMHPSLMQASHAAGPAAAAAAPAALPAAASALAGGSGAAGGTLRAPSPTTGGPAGGPSDAAALTAATPSAGAAVPGGLLDSDQFRHWMVRPQGQLQLQGQGPAAAAAASILGGAGALGGPLHGAGGMGGGAPMGLTALGSSGNLQQQAQQQLGGGSSGGAAAAANALLSGAGNFGGAGLGIGGLGAQSFTQSLMGPPQGAGLGLGMGMGQQFAGLGSGSAANLAGMVGRGPTESTSGNAGSSATS